jgi:choline dehydrogenase-like flavoprotein
VAVYTSTHPIPSYTLITIMIAHLGALALAAFAPATEALSVHSGDASNPYNVHRAMFKREITTDVSRATSQSWDFIIAGGGLAGLAVAARLSEWSNTTVLVIEAGSDGTDVQDQVNVPGYSYLNGLTGEGKGTDWHYTIDTSSTGSSSSSWPRGKLLGGSGAVNGMFWGRGSEDDYNAWATLNPGTNQTWGWDEMDKYIKKAENFGAPPQATQDEFSMPIDTNAHGHDGPIHVAMSEFIYPAVANWIPAWEELGFTALDLAAGSVHGAMIVPSTMFVSNHSRCDSKAGYIDSIAPRSNLLILTGQQVTKVNFNGTDSNNAHMASGVNFASAAGVTETTVYANKEVILCGGTVGSAQLLQLSGIGPQSVLEAAGVETIYDLPVGYNLQDHVSNSLYFTSQSGVDTWGAFRDNTVEQASALTEWRESGTGKWTYVNEAVGYVTMQDINTEYASIASSLDTNALVSQYANSHGYPSSVQSGLARQYELQKQFLTGETGQLEIILTMLGGGTKVGIQVAVQHPFSRGSLHITSNSAFNYPTINPDYLSCSIDQTVALNGFEFARRLANTTASRKFMGDESDTGDLTGDSLFNNYKAYAGTEYHPCSSCSMLPESDGGVVDTNLRVYGTNNLRVIDASIIPLHVSAHLMATTYGIAEKGADIIKNDWVYVAPAPSSSSAGHSSTSNGAESTASATTSSTGKANSEDAGSTLSSGAKLGIGIGVGVGVAALLAAIVSSTACLLLL